MTAMCLRWWLNSKRLASRSSASTRSSAVLLKKERERSSLSARAPSYYDYENNFYFMSLSSPEAAHSSSL